MRRQSSTTKPFTFKANEKVQKMTSQRRETLFFVLIRKACLHQYSKCQKSNPCSSQSHGFIALQNWFLYPRNRIESYVLVTENEVTIIGVNHKVPGVFYAGYTIITPFITK
jgi:hypothetical protein